MYVAALRVKGSDGRVGTNAFLHLHRELEVPLRGPGDPDLDAVGSLQGGYLVAQTIELHPGGNDVLAHLDVVAADDATDTAISGLVDELRTRIGKASTPMVVSRGGMAVRFGANTGFDDQPDDLRNMFDSLWAASRSLLTQRQAVPQPVSGPYVVWVEAAADGVRLWLPPTTLARLPASVRRRARVLVPTGTMSLGTPAQALRDVAVMLLDLDEARVAKESGIELVEPQTGGVLAAFPRRASG